MNNEILTYFDASDEMIYRVFANRFGFRVLRQPVNYDVTGSYEMAACVAYHDETVNNLNLGISMVSTLRETKEMIDNARMIMEWASSVMI